MADESRASSYIRILTVISMVLGLLTLLESGQEMYQVYKEQRQTIPNYWRSQEEAESNEIKWQRVQKILAATMVTSFLQILFCAVVFILKECKWSAHPMTWFWMGFHFVIFFLCLFSFLWKLDLRRSDPSDQFQNFVIFTKIIVANWIFCLVACFLLYNVVDDKDKDKTKCGIQGNDLVMV